VHLDRDAALALEVHRVEQLLFHLTHGDRTRYFEETIRERGFPVVDVRDDAKISNVCSDAFAARTGGCDGHYTYRIRQ